MAPLGLFPVLVAMVNLNLIQTESGGSLGVTLNPVTKPIPAAVVEKDAFIHSSSKQKREVDCTGAYYLHPNKTHCCIRCHKGTFVAQHCLDSDRATKCSVCSEGSFIDGDNSSEKCRGCRRCRPTFGQIELSKCTSEHDTVCGCGRKQYQSSHSDEFTCKNCSVCPHGKIRLSCECSRTESMSHTPANTSNDPSALILTAGCTTFSDTICECLPGFFLQKDENKCYPCSSCNSEKECEMACKMALVTKPENNPQHTILTILVIIFGATCALLLVNTFRKRSCQKRFGSTFCPYASNLQPTSEPSPEVVEKAKCTFLEQNQIENLLPQKATPADLPDCVRVAGETQISDRPEVLYAVVDHVPLPRWNEFVRRLGLNEISIERIYAEHRHIREAQYVMLRQWRQQAGHSATVERICYVLNQMEMSGCSETIQEVLSKLP
ncbi:tumor necrosis factor receptor superfamily member 1A-like [Lacerta agilis]|uniref:tumor necrosis factor receptor superfamily member 1A-like n=1 Tax=Lacerta agilis TaxID=80427 RepID=UPI00141A0DE5|nr:tumor necrosis factor receptor superfamily member 1A-like [Lacerta agilis]